MIAIEIQFLAGRFHATPWARNVNEGEVEWPISPFRLSRGLIDVWKRRFPELVEARIERILTALSEPPYFHLPPATTTHTRSFLSSNKEDPTAKQKIFDAFVAVDKTTPFYILFHADLTVDDRETLDLLLHHMSYLGRAESWINARLLPDTPDVSWNCRPVSTNPSHSGCCQAVQVACLQPPYQYNSLSILPEKRPWQAAETGNGKCSWVEAISLSSKDLLGDGWSAPPVLSWVDYTRPANVFNVCTPRTRRSQREMHYLKYAVQSNVLPLIEETVSVAEKVRNHLMGIYRVKCGGDPLAASQNFSGKDKDGHTLSGHGHAFYLPVDEDGDGRIDHVIVESRSAFSEKEISALDSLRSVWQSNGREDLRFILTSSGSEVRPCESRSWVSATPFVTIRHYKKSWGNYEDWLKHEVMLECQYNDLPAPKDIYSISHTPYANPAKRWAAFMRNRTGRQALPGYGFILEFDQAVAGPFTLGSLGHYGLGLFIALREPLLRM